MELSQLLLRTRKQQGLSREALSGLAKVSTTFIRDAEKDVANCSFGKLMTLLDALGLQWNVHAPDQPHLQHSRPSETGNEPINKVASSLVTQENLAGKQP